MLGIALSLLGRNFRKKTFKDHICVRHGPWKGHFYLAFQMFTTPKQKCSTNDLEILVSVLHTVTQVWFDGFQVTFTSWNKTLEEGDSNNSNHSNKCFALIELHESYVMVIFAIVFKMQNRHNFKIWKFLAVDILSLD